MTNDASLAWRWGTNYWLSATSGLHGSIHVASGWRPYGVTTAITVSAAAYYHFTNWSGDVNPAQMYDHPLNLLMDRPRSVAAVFGENLAAQGTPEWWLADYGWTNDFDAAALADQDGDGHRTWEEYIAGTVPTNRGSVLKVLYGSGGVFSPYIIRWFSATARVYKVECSTNALDGFQLLGTASNLPATPNENVYTNNDLLNGPWLFYRVNVRKEAP